MQIENQETSKTDQEVEEEIEETLPFKYSITSYGADYTVEMLVKKIKESSIIIPQFQREYVWMPRQASRFVESLLLGLPVPGIFLYKDENSKLVVIDGQQRLKTLQYFYDGIFPKTKKEFDLVNVQEDFIGKSYRTLDEEDRLRLNDSIIHATIIKQDKPSEDESSIYHIFERINTEGMSLQPQEIRACIYHGKFNELLKELNKNKNWRDIFGVTNLRMRDQELILRFFAFYFNSSEYKKPMKEFLNKFMGSHMNLKEEGFEERATEIFEKTIKIVRDYLGTSAFKPTSRIIASIFDAFMFATAKRLEKGEIVSKQDFINCYNILLKNEKFINSDTSDDASVKTRMAIAIDIPNNKMK